MDGTLTEPRKLVENDMINFIKCLSRHSRIGVVTGSPSEYVFEQLGPGFLSWSESVKKNISIYPCNGTQVFKYDLLTKEYSRQFKTTFMEYLATIGEAQTLYTHLIMNLLDLQSYAIKSYPSLTVAGHFISFRETE